MIDTYERVFMDSIDPILIEDLDGIIFDMNMQAELSYGWTKNELVGKPHLIIGQYSDLNLANLKWRWK